jgi:hypothetical protein
MGIRVSFHLVVIVIVIIVIIASQLGMIMYTHTISC